MKRAPRLTGELEIRMLGELEVTLGGDPLPLPASKKSRALLAYLVATGTAHPRERLCELFWDTPDDPRAALRWSLTKIRPLLDREGTTRLLADRERVTFAPSKAVVDLTEVRMALRGDLEGIATDILERSAARFRGEFLEGLDLPGCYRYHAWCVAEREAVRSLRVSVLGALAARFGEKPERALPFARARVAVDPLAESGHTALVRLLGRLGRTKDALTQYETCRHILENELRTRPSSELEQARRDLLQSPSVPSSASAPSSGSASSSASAPSPSPASRSSSLDVPQRTIFPPPQSANARGEGGAPRSPLVGRRRELGVLTNAVRATASSEPGGVLLLVGDPGIGKTRLLEELRTLVRQKGGKVLEARAFEAEMVRPYGVFLDALRSFPLPELPSSQKAELAPLLPELSPNSAASATTDKSTLFDAVLGLLSMLGRETPPALLLLDDLQWFDESSVALLHFIARAEPQGVLIAAGARGGELADNPAALRLVRALSRAGKFVQIELGPLDDGETAELVRDLGQDVDVSRVFAESEGSPLFAIEMVRALTRGEADVSGNLQELIAGRLERLDPRAADLLPWAAALGRSFRAELLSQVTSMGPTELLAAIDDLERRAILRSAVSVEGGIGYDFCHDLIRQTAYRRTSEPRRRLIHLQIARTLSSLPDESGALAGDLAHHAAMGGDDALTVRACAAAGERCLRLFAKAEAAELADRGLARIFALPREVRIHEQIRLLRIRVLSGTWRNHVAELEREFSRIILEAQAAGLHAEVASGLHAFSELHWESGQLGGAVASSLKLADVSHAADPITAAKTLAHAGRCLAQLDQEMVRAWSLLRDAEDRAAHLDLALPDVSLGLGIVHHHTGEDDRAIEFFERAHAAAARTFDHWLEWESLSRLVMIELERGAPREALRRWEKLGPLAAKMGEGSEMPVTLALRALACLALDEPNAAADAERTIAALRNIDTKGHLAYVLTTVAEIERGRGEKEIVERRLGEALAASEAVGRRTEVARARVLLARIAIEGGHFGTAAAHVGALAADVAKPLGLAFAVRTAVQNLAAELGLDLDDLVTASTNATRPENRRRPPRKPAAGN